MDDELLRFIYHLLFDSDSAYPGRRQTCSDAIVAWIHFHAVLSNRSHHWAHDKCTWPPSREMEGRAGFEPYRSTPRGFACSFIAVAVCAGSPDPESRGSWPLRPIPWSGRFLNRFITIHRRRTALALFLVLAPFSLAM
jgi:hypothetical protein